MYKLKENKKGITLIALVVTIIVLLILAGVAISNNNAVIPILLWIGIIALLPTR